jgi:hypothetical protein
LVATDVSFEGDSHPVEGLALPGSPYLAVDEECDREVAIRSFVDENQQASSRLRIARLVCEF